MVTPPKKLDDFQSLVEIVEALRGPEGCPWDKEQTHRSLTPYAIEEAHELADAIETGQTKDIIEELGDVLLQVVLHSEVASQSESPEQQFTITNVIASISEKMVRRHPHVFSDVSAKDSDEVLKNWQEIKAQEKTPLQDRFDLPHNLPALQKSKKIGSKTKKFNFDWDSVDQVLLKVEEELQEVKEALSEKNHEAIEDEIGDLLFSVAQLARHSDIEPEQALRKANHRFEKRFFNMKKNVEQKNKELTQLSLSELEEAWQNSKKELKNTTT